MGNLFNESMYDMQIELNHIPFLEETLDSAGLLTYHPVTEVTAYLLIFTPLSLSAVVAYLSFPLIIYLTPAHPF